MVATLKKNSDGLILVLTCALVLFTFNVGGVPEEKAPVEQALRTIPDQIDIPEVEPEIVYTRPVYIYYEDGRCYARELTVEELAKVDRLLVRNERRRQKAAEEEMLAKLHEDIDELNAPEELLAMVLESKPNPLLDENGLSLVEEALEEEISYVEIEVISDRELSFDELQEKVKDLPFKVADSRPAFVHGGQYVCNTRFHR